jgi:hypothetical protein
MTPGMTRMEEELFVPLPANQVTTYSRPDKSRIPPRTVHIRETERSGHNTKTKPRAMVAKAVKTLLRRCSRRILFIDTPSFYY